MPKLKEKDRKKLQGDIDKFLAAGGEIEIIPDKFKSRFDAQKPKDANVDLIDTQAAASLVGCTIYHIGWLYKNGFIKNRTKLPGFGKKYFYNGKEIRDLIKKRGIEHEKK